jgi:hypothetical protein
MAKKRKCLVSNYHPEVLPKDQILDSNARSFACTLRRHALLLNSIFCLLNSSLPSLPLCDLCDRLHSFKSIFFIARIA